MKKRSARRSYGDDDRVNALAALKANGQNFLRTARQLGIPRKTLQNWAKGQKGFPAVADRLAMLAHQKEEDLATKLEALAHQLLEMVPSKLADATLPQLMTAVGIGIDKLLRLRQQRPAGADGTAGQVTIYIPDNGRDNPPPGGADSPPLTPDDRRAFFIALGQALAPYPDAKKAVSGLLENLVARTNTGAPDHD
jgi:transposase-like protein